MYYIAGWVLNYIKQRCEHDGDKCGSPWLWPVWVLHNVLNPIKNSHGGIINSLLTAIIREGGRAFDRLAYASVPLFAFMWRVEHVYCTLVTNELLAITIVAETFCPW